MAVKSYDTDIDLKAVVKLVAEQRCAERGYQFSAIDEKDMETLCSKLQIGSFQYSSVISENQEVDSVYSTSCINNTDAAATKKVVHTCETSATYELTMKPSLSIPSLLTFKVYVPFYGRLANIELPGLNFTLGSQKKPCKENIPQKWSVEQKVAVPPHSKVHVDLQVIKVHFTAEYTVQIGAPMSHEIEITRGDPLPEVQNKNSPSTLRMALGIMFGMVLGAVVAGLIGMVLGVAFGWMVANGGVGWFQGTKDERKFKVTARDVFQCLPGFKLDKNRGLVYYQTKGILTGKHGVHHKVMLTQHSPNE